MPGLPVHHQLPEFTQIHDHVMSQWCHPNISSSVVPFFSCLQSSPASGSFSMSQFFTSGGQSIGASASALVLPMNTQNWSPLGWTGWISLQSKGLSRVFSNTMVQIRRVKSWHRVAAIVRITRKFPSVWPPWSTESSRRKSESAHVSGSLRCAKDAELLLCARKLVVCDYHDE